VSYELRAARVAVAAWRLTAHYSLLKAQPSFFKKNSAVSLHIENNVINLREFFYSLRRPERPNMVGMKNVTDGNGPNAPSGTQ